MIANSVVRGLFHELVDLLGQLHEGVVLHRSPVDIRVEYAGRMICRVVPYRELVHLLVGDDPVWEVRVRDETGYLDAVGRILDAFLACVASGDGSGGPRGSRPGGLAR